MTEWTREATKLPRARLIGAVYLAYFLTAILAEVLAGRGLAAWGTAVNLIATALYLALTLLFYVLFRPVSRGLSLIAALFSVAGCVVTAMGIFNINYAWLSPLLFFGPYCLLLGYLIFRSRFLPHALGVILAVAGVGWLAFLIPTLPHFLSLAIEGLGVFAEASLMLWLIVRGVNVERWKLQADAASQRFIAPHVSRNAGSSTAPDQGGRG